MTCDCHSYNADVGSTPEVVLPRPWFMEGSDQRPAGVPIDACIANVVAHLWNKRLVTLASCCGHNGINPALDWPNLVIEQNVDPEPYLEAIAEVDDRSWTLYQWQLVDVAVQPPVSSSQENP